jgi:hypothetical protein
MGAASESRGDLPAASPGRPRASGSAAGSTQPRRPAPLQVTPRDDGTVTLSRDSAVTLTIPGPASEAPSYDSSTSTMGSSPAPSASGGTTDGATYAPSYPQ